MRPRVTTLVKSSGYYQSNFSTKKCMSFLKPNPLKTFFSLFQLNNGKVFHSVNSMHVEYQVICHT